MVVTQIKRKGKADISPVSLHWPNGQLVKAGELKADEYYIYTLNEDGSYFTVYNSSLEDSDDKDNLA